MLPRNICHGYQHPIKSADKAMQEFHGNNFFSRASEAGLVRELVDAGKMQVQRECYRTEKPRLLPERYVCA